MWLVKDCWICCVDCFFVVVGVCVKFEFGVLS